MEVKPGSPEWARFDDWLSEKLGRYSDWTIVAESFEPPGLLENEFSEYRAIFSYLAPNKLQTVKKLFQYDTWDVQFNIGSFYLDELKNKSEFCEDLGDKESRIFISLKSEIGAYPSVWKLWPSFENYFDLRSDTDGNLVDPYSGELVAKIPCPAHTGPVCIRTDYLQDYLAARKMVLIRQHDHRRFWNKAIENLPEREGDLTVHIKDWGCYTLCVDNSGTSIHRHSRLVAKDIVVPYARAGTVGIRKKVELEMSDCPEFITGKGLDGTEEKRKPDPDDILHPAYFSSKVLKRYYDEPSRYHVGFHAPGMGGVSFLNQWSIPVGKNDEGLIIIWLGDLLKAGLPYDEIVHWRAHNVPPRGCMAMDFWNAQMMCKPPETPSLEARLLDCRHLISKTMDKRGKAIYKTYEGPDKYVEKTLRVPLFDEHNEFQITISQLSKMFIEYLNDAMFRNELPEEQIIDEQGNRLGNIVVFSNWLENIIGVPRQVAGNIKHALQNVQMVRSKTGVAHRFSDSAYQEVIRKLGISGSRVLIAKALFSAVAEPLAETLEELCGSLGVKNQLWWLKKTEGKRK